MFITYIVVIVINMFIRSSFSDVDSVKILKSAGKQYSLISC